MFSASDLSEEQIEVIRGWVAEGAQMADVQKRLQDDLGFKVTYMDTRFLSLDLDLQFEVEEVEEEEKEADEVVEPELVGEDPPSNEIPLGGEVLATLDQVARPGAMVSGTVTFGDGMNGVWMIDEMGRPSIDPDQAGYQPSEGDLVSFQDKLKVMLDGHV